MNETLEIAERNDERLFEPELLGLRAELTPCQPPGHGDRHKPARRDLQRARIRATENDMKLWSTYTAARTRALFQ